MQPEHQAALRSLAEARTLPEDVSEMRSGTGRTLHIERLSDFKQDLVLSDLKDIKWLAIGTSVGAKRPSRYPSGFPFLSSCAAAFVSVDEEVTISWNSSDGAPVRAQPTVDESVLKEVNDKLAPVFAQVREGDPETRAAAAKKIGDLMESLDPKVKQQFLAAMQPPADDIQKMSTLFREACDDSEGDGWTETERREKSEPVKTAMVVYQKDQLSRRITLLPFGTSVIVMLFQGSLENDAAA